MDVIEFTLQEFYKRAPPLPTKKGIVAHVGPEEGFRYIVT